MALQIAPLIVPERRRPIPDGVLFAVGRTPQLVLAANNGTALSYAPLSDFLSSIAELRMGKGIEPADQAQCLPSCKHEFSNGNSASIVLKSKRYDRSVQGVGNGVCFDKRNAALPLL